MNKSGEIGAKYLGEALIENSTLLSFSLNANEIQNEGFKDIALALIKNKSVNYLCLCDNMVVDIAPIIPIIQDYQCLTNLELSNYIYI